MSEEPRAPFRLKMLLPGVLIAATGVGAGDLLTAGLAGSKLGTAILWSALYGALLKWVLNEGLARWQMATGTTLLEGWVSKLGAWIQWIFLPYLLLWSFFVGGALVGACGVAGHGLVPLAQPEAVERAAGETDAGFAERKQEAVKAAARTNKIVWGVAHSMAGLALVLLGGFKLFEVVMAVCIAVMFATVLAAALLIGPDWGAVAEGLLVPRIPYADPEPTFVQSLRWVVGVMGGVGGTATLLCYGYWIRREGRAGAEGVRACRIDLGVGYLLTALFGMAMIVICAGLKLEKAGADYAPALATRLAEIFPADDWRHGALRGIFLLGFWGAVFSSLLGVWQGVPYLFADFLRLRRGDTAEAERAADLTRTRPYRVFLVALAVLPLVLLWGTVKQVQLAYAVLGAFFMPLLALTLLLMNNREAWVGKRFVNSFWINALLALTLVFFAGVGVQEILEGLAKFAK
ncbi:MAG: Nramp family divalent metal transporter [Planctomycetota bacterium]|nr:Nramp family divalent metal transporter [Planctomycetota bacterium]